MGCKDGVIGGVLRLLLLRRRGRTYRGNIGFLQEDGVVCLQSN